MSNGYVVRVVDGPSTGATAFTELPLVVGREGDLVVADPTVSRKHARIEPTTEGLRIIDLGSASGTLVNGHPTSGVELSAGDLVELGSSSLRILRLLRYADAAAGAALRIRDRGKDRVVSLRDGATVGRDPDCDVVVDDATVSRHHATFHIAPGRVELEDLGSSNGTRVSGRTVRDRVGLTDGAEIQVGRWSAHLTFTEGAAATPVSVRVSVEGSEHPESMSIDAGIDATVAQVTAELARVVGAPDRELLMYRPEEGALLHPDDRWAATGVRAGDQYVLGVGDASEFTAAEGRRWPARRARTLNQLPRTVWPEPAHIVERIDPPESTSFRGRGIVWQIAGGLGAVLIGLVLVLINPAYAVFGMITGGIGIISITASVLGDQSRRRHKVSEFRRRLGDLDVALQGARLRQCESLESLSPPVEELESWLASVSPRIWERRPSDPDALRLMIGTGRCATRMELERARGSDSPFTRELDDVVSRHTHLDYVPVTAPGPGSGSLGVIGDDGHVRALLARMIIEAAVLHPPNQLRIWVAATDPGWEWCRWLPHVAGDGPSHDVKGAADLIAAAQRDVDDSDCLHLVVVPGMAGRFALDTSAAARSGRELIVVGATDRRDLPGGLAVLVDIAHDGAAEVIGSYPEAPIGPLAVSGVDESTAERLAVALARLSGPSSQVAPSGLVELLGLGSAMSPDVAGSWARNDPDRLTAAVGTDHTGAPVTIGFRRDGPHGVIAGTTGSGKSELLQTVLTAMALRNPPERLNLFMVDFKGGSTFAPLAALPHVVGLVTDIEHDSSLAGRALTSLDAEIDRRKRLLDAARVPDVVAYEHLDDVEALPDLIVVIDEFALLVERQPEVRDRLDTIATQGRSLGIHLLLATQSPSGVITHAIRTNTNLWICLRVVTESESMEILGTRDAARISDGSPGLAIIRLGAGTELRTFQAARIARPVPDPETPVRATRLAGGGPPDPQAGARVTELDMVAARISAVADERGGPAATPLWLAPLPDRLDPDRIEQAPRPADRLVVLVGLQDLPREHAQRPFEIDLSAAGHALITGVFGFGKTTTLLQVAADVAGHRSPEDVHLYAIDSGSGSLGPLGMLPHVGDVVGASDVERLTRLVDRLLGEVDSRREQLATSGTGDFLRWRAAGGDVPWIVLLVDDYPAMREVAEDVESGRLLERFNSLLQNGPAVGVHTVVSTPQAVDLRSREVNLMAARMALRAADSADYALVDARFAPNEVPKLPPGRALVAGDTQVQVVLVDPDTLSSGMEQWASIDEARLAAQVERLPTSVERAAHPARKGGLVLGVGGAEVDAVEVLPDNGSVVLLVAGPRQSGRSTTLHALWEALTPRPAHALVVAPRPGPLRDLSSSDSVALQTETSGIVDALDSFADGLCHGSVLVIDDAEVVSGVSGVSDRLERLLRAAPDAGTTVLVGARINDLPALFDPWIRYLMSLRRVVLLQPTVDDAFLFGAKLPTIPPPMVAGRGIFIDGQSVTVLQAVGPEQR